MAVNDLAILAGEGGSSMAFVADSGNAALNTALLEMDYDDEMDAAPLSTLQDAGWITEDGLTSGRDFATENLPAYGTKNPVRVFNTTDNKTFTINFLETNPVTVAVYDLKKLSDVTATGGVLESISGEAAGTASYTLVFDVKDGDRGQGKIIVPNAEVSAVTERTIRGGQAIVRGVTFTAKPTSILPTGGTAGEDEEVVAVREVWYVKALNTTP